RSLCARGDILRPRSSTGERCKILNRHWDRSIPTSQISSPTSPPSSPIKAGPVKPRACCGGRSPLPRRHPGLTLPPLPAQPTNLHTPPPPHAMSAQGRRAGAEALYGRSLTLREAGFGTESAAVAVALDNLAALLHAQRRFAEAEPLVRRSLAIREKSFDPTHPLIGNSLNNLASTLDNLQRHAEAEPLLARALAVREAALRGNHPEVDVTVAHLASPYLDLGQWQEAYAAFKRATAIWINRRRAGLVASQEAQRTEMRDNADPFLGFVVAAYHAGAGGGAAALQLRAEAFESAQWVVGA